MSDTAGAPQSSIDYDQVDETELRNNQENIEVYKADGRPVKKTALKVPYTIKIKHNEISESYVRALGFQTHKASGARKETIELTWRFRTKSMDAEFRIVAPGKYDIVLGEEALEQLAAIRRGPAVCPCVVEKGRKAERERLLSQKAQDRLRQEKEREKERQEDRRKLLQQQRVVIVSSVA